MKIDLMKIRLLLNNFNNETVLRKDKTGRPNIYILIDNFTECDYKAFQEDLFEVVPEKYISEIYITEFYRQFTIFLKRVEYEFIGLNDKDVNEFARMKII